MTSIDDDVHAYITDRQRTRRKGVPLALIAATHGPAGVAAAHRLIQAGRAYWATNAARPTTRHDRPSTTRRQHPQPGWTYPHEARTPTTPRPTMSAARHVTTATVPITQLDDYPGNARTHCADVLRESIRTNGQYRAIVARRKPDCRLEVLAGHGTRNALAAEGETEARVEIIECDDETARRIVLVDNRASDLAGYNEAALLALLDAQSADGWDGTGWDGDAFKELLDAADDGNPFDWQGPDADELDDQDPTPPVDEDTITQPGDVWVLGRHRLVCGDSTDPAVWARLMLPGERADLVWTDPPYGVAYVGKTEDALTIENDDLDEAGLAAMLQGAFANALAACKPGAAWYVASPAGPLFHVFGAELRRIDVWRHTIIWVKDQFVLGRADYHYRHEPIFYGWKPGAAHQPPPDRKQDTVWEYPRPKRSADHPTMKPIALVQRAIENSTDEGGIVADAFGGSGTTLLAAEITGRAGRLVELGPAYCDVIVRRWEEATGERAERETA